MQAMLMVTNLREGTKTKCHQYWPETGTQSFGPFKVTIIYHQPADNGQLYHSLLVSTGA